MSSIHLLENSLINKIAAGEVIERPASVVKELVENSIDSGAATVTVSIKDGGTSLISVTDNGCGIPQDEVKTAFLRHATSKLQKFDDLENILTMGFRGEALASIAAVSQLEMITKTKDESTGTSIKINGGVTEDVKPVGCADGTTVQVKNIFYNTPARKKFLKRNSTEGSYVADVINKIALGHPEISFKLINNGVVIMQTNGNGDLKTTAFGILGRDCIRASLPLNSAKDGWKLEGFIVKPEIARGNRSYESFYINKRFIKSDLLKKAAEDGYKGYLMGGKFPVVVLNLTPPPGCVDVNVHPTKSDVRFNDESFIFDFISGAVSKTLKGETLIPDAASPDFSEMSGIKPIKAEEITIDLDAMLDEIEKKEAEEENKKGYFDIRPLEPVSLTLNEPKAPVAEKPVQEEKVVPLSMVIDHIEEKEEQEKKAKSEGEAILPPTPKKKPFFHNYRIIGQIFFTYWLIQQGNELYIIDQHAAHEKVLYEKLSERIRARKVSSQLLLEPVSITVTLREKRIIEENMELFTSIGFEIEAFGRNTYSIRAVPFIFDGTANPVFFTEIVDALEAGRIKDGFELKQDKIAQISCKAAVKGNNVLSYQEARALIEDLLKLDNPFNCPHGRPTIIKISKYEIEKKFKRIL